MIRFDVTEFLEANRIAAAEGGGSQAVADLLGLTLGQVGCRRHALKRKGIRLPSLRKRAGRKSRAQTLQPSRGCGDGLNFTLLVGG